MDDTSAMGMRGLHTRLVVAGALGCLSVAGAGLLVRPWLEASAWYAWKAVAVAAAMTAVAVALVREHPFPRLGPATRVTIVRAMLVALLAALVGEPDSQRVAWAAVATAILVTVLDGVDGWLARRSGMTSAFGGRIDMETDALLVMVLSLLVWQHGKAGGWILIGGLLRYAFVAAGWGLPWMAGPLTPTRRAKTITVCHLVGLNVALAPLVRPTCAAMAAGATLAGLTWSFAVDVGRLWGQRHVVGSRQ
ncbi:MAG: CDP-alcohol phosphatidyltransferase family protein [Acidobacteria bacterium]|nr:CDP-alcohol phosphatidyltransferase family protein [Acidobacteriota bacterium]